MKFVIWGAGILGRRMLQILQAQKCSVEAIIDVDSRKIGLRIGDTPIISFDSYKKHYKKCLIIIATNSLADINIIRKCLERNGIYTYVSMLDNPSEILSGSFYKLPFNEMLKTVHFDSSNSHISLWGLNVFALLLYQYIKQFTRFSCSLINLNWNVQMLELLREEYHILDSFVDNSLSKFHSLIFAKMKIYHYIFYYHYLYFSDFCWCDFFLLLLIHILYIYHYIALIQ